MFETQLDVATSRGGFNNPSVSYYRNTYLKSQDWKTLRLAKLNHQKERCQICGFTSSHNDVHHVKYRRLYDVECQDLRVLCRGCHDGVHALLEKYPKLKSLPRAQIWKIVKDHALKETRIANQTKKNEWRARGRNEKKRQAFSLFRNQLVIAGKVFRPRMVWHDSLFGCENISQTAEEYLEIYMLTTGCDPRVITTKTAT